METLTNRAVLVLALAPLLLVAVSAQSTKASAQSGINLGNKLKIVDGIKYPKTAEGIQAAITDIGESPGVVLLPPGVYEISSEIKVAQTGISIMGFGFSTELHVVNPQINVFNVSAGRFQLSNMEIRTAIIKTAGSIILVNGEEGVVRNIRIVGSFFNGFTLQGSVADGWSFEDINVKGPANWNYLFHLQSASRTIADTHIRNLMVSNRIAWKVAGTVLDTGVDTFTCIDCEPGPVLVQNTLNGIAPRWIRFETCFIEAGINGATTGTAIDIEASTDFRFRGYIASSENGVKIGPHAESVDISHTEFVNIGHSAATIAIGAKDVTLASNSFQSTANQADGRYDTISVAGGATGFQILNNAFSSTGKNQPRFNINVGPGSSHYVINGNSFQGFRKTGLNDEGNERNRWISSNL
jgi:hypothetical protein